MARRALAAVAVVGIAAVGLTACSGSKDKAASGSSEGKSLVVTYYKTSSFPQIEDFMKRAKEEFESTHKDVTIDLQPVEADADQYMTKLALMNKSKSKAPDIIYEDTFQVMSDAAAGYLAPIDDYVKNWDEWSQYPESSIQGAKGLDGKLYGVPFGTDSTTTRRSLSRPDCPLIGSPRAGMTFFLLRAPSRKRCPMSSP